MSFLFYEAQRSGKRAANDRIKWRGDSGLSHKAPDGRDVTGGWYDAGDNVKFNLPMAWSAGVIAWSLVDFKQARGRVQGAPGGRREGRQTAHGTAERCAPELLPRLLRCCHATPCA